MKMVHNMTYEDVTTPANKTPNYVNVKNNNDILY